MTIAIPDFNSAQVDVGSKTVGTDEMPMHIPVDGLGRYGEVDAVGGYLVTIDEPHHKIHEGELFRISHKVSLTAGTIHNMTLTTGSGTAYPHIVMWLSADDKTEVGIYKSPTVSVAGTDITGDAINLNGSSSNTPSGLTITSGDTVTADGTLIEGAFVDKLISVRSISEIILAPSTTYLIKVDDSVLNKAPVIYMGIDWYNQAQTF